MRKFRGKVEDMLKEIFEDGCKDQYNSSWKTWEIYDEIFQKISKFWNLLEEYRRKFWKNFISNFEEIFENMFEEKSDQ